MYIPEDIWGEIKSYLIVPYLKSLREFRTCVIPNLPKYIPLLIIPRKKLLFDSRLNKYLLIERKIEYMKIYNCNYSVVYCTQNNNKY